MLSTPQELFWSTCALTESSQTCTYFSHAHSSIRAFSSPSCELNVLPPHNLIRCRTYIRAFDRHSVNFIATEISRVWLFRHQATYSLSSVPTNDDDPEDDDDDDACIPGRLRAHRQMIAWARLVLDDLIDRTRMDRPGPAAAAEPLPSTNRDKLRLLYTEAPTLTRSCGAGLNCVARRDAMWRDALLRPTFQQRTYAYVRVRAQSLLHLWERTALYMYVSMFAIAARNPNELIC